MEKPTKPTYPACCIVNKPVKYNLYSKVICFEEKNFCSKQDALDNFAKVSKDLINEFSKEIPNNALNIKLITSVYIDDYDREIDDGFKVVWETENLNYENELNHYNNQVDNYNKAIEKYKLELAKYEEDIKEYRKYIKDISEANVARQANIAKENLQKYLAKNSSNIDMNVVNKLMEKIK